MAGPAPHQRHLCHTSATRVGASPPPTGPRSPRGSGLETLKTASRTSKTASRTEGGVPGQHGPARAPYEREADLQECGGAWKTTMRGRRKKCSQREQAPTSGPHLGHHSWLSSRGQASPPAKGSGQERKRSRQERKRKTGESSSSEKKNEKSRRSRLEKQIASRQGEPKEKKSKQGRQAVGHPHSQMRQRVWKGARRQESPSEKESRRETCSRRARASACSMPCG